MSISKASVLTSVFDTILTIASQYSGVGFVVSYYERTTNVVKLTTTAAHGFAAGDKIVVRGISDTCDGEFTIVAVPTTTTLTYAATGADQGSTALSPTAGVSSRIGAGYRRFDDVENWEQLVQSMTPETAGWFDLEIGRVTLSADGIDVYPAKLKAALVVYVPKDVSTNLSVAWDFALAFFQALIASSEYAGVWPNKLTFSLRGIDTIDAGGIATFDCGCYGDGGIEVPDP